MLYGAWHNACVLLVKNVLARDALTNIAPTQLSTAHESALRWNGREDTWPNEFKSSWRMTPTNPLRTRRWHSPWTESTTRSISAQQMQPACGTTCRTGSVMRARPADAARRVAVEARARRQPSAQMSLRSVNGLERRGCRSATGGGSPVRFRTPTTRRTGNAGHPRAAAHPGQGRAAARHIQGVAPATGRLIPARAAAARPDRPAVRLVRVPRRGWRARGSCRSRPAAPPPRCVG